MKGALITAFYALFFEIGAFPFRMGRFLEILDSSVDNTEASQHLLKVLHHVDKRINMILGARLGEGEGGENIPFSTMHSQKTCMTIPAKAST